MSESDNMQGAYRKAMDVWLHGQKLVDSIPATTASEATLVVYRAVYAAVRADLATLRSELCAKSTYFYRRAACLAIVREDVLTQMSVLMSAGRDWAAGSGTRMATSNAAVDLAETLSIAQKIVDLIRDREQAEAGTGGAPAPGFAPKLPGGAKRNLLSDIPRDWLDILWANTPENWHFRQHLAVAVLIPSRVADWKPGDRGDDGNCEGVVIQRVGQLLRLVVLAAKARGGTAGAGWTEIEIDPQTAPPAAKFLYEQCSDGPCVVQMATDAFRAALRRLGECVFAADTPRVTPNLIRAQVMADAKATHGAGPLVAALAGHGTERSQSRYGHRIHGRPRKGYVAVRPARIAKQGHIDRARQLSEDRAQHCDMPKKPTD